jgi:hypothetical protein
VGTGRPVLCRRLCRRAVRLHAGRQGVRGRRAVLRRCLRGGGLRLPARPGALPRQVLRGGRALPGRPVPCRLHARGPGDELRGGQALRRGPRQLRGAGRLRRLRPRGTVPRRTVRCCGAVGRRRSGRRRRLRRPGRSLRGRRRLLLRPVRRGPRGGSARYALLLRCGRGLHGGPPLLHRPLRRPGPVRLPTSPGRVRRDLLPARPALRRRSVRRRLRARGSGRHVPGARVRAGHRQLRRTGRLRWVWGRSAVRPRDLRSRGELRGPRPALPGRNRLLRRAGLLRRQLRRYPDRPCPLRRLRRVVPGGDLRGRCV